MTSRSFSERIAAVNDVIDAARHLARAPGTLISELTHATGLSHEGVVLGLAEHLETDATADEIAALVTHASEAPHVHVVLSANVFVAGLRAIALAVAAAPEVTIRASSREPHFARALVARMTMPGVRVTPEARPEGVKRGEIHVYGRNETIAAVTATAAAGVTVRGHGAGMGVAIVSAGADVVASASAVARDVIAFDQRGCLSPRLVFVPPAAGPEFAAALSGALEALGRIVPRGALQADEAAEAERYASTVAFAGHLLRGAGHLVGFATSVVVPPPGRHLHVVAADDLAVRSSVAKLARSIVAVGASHPEAVARWAPPHARLSRLGTMQQPRLDGPVDRRT